MSEKPSKPNFVWAPPLLLNRRQLLGTAALFFSSTVLGTQGAFAADSACPVTDHLNGIFPEEGAPRQQVISTVGRFHHYHYLYIPSSILVAPPAEGWATLSSMMVVALGMDPYFTRMPEHFRQYHCHQITVSQQQLQGIASGRSTAVNAFIEGSNRPNHTFLFNRDNRHTSESFQAEFSRIQTLARGRRLETRRILCERLPARLQAVTVYHPQGDFRVTSVDQINSLKGY